MSRLACVPTELAYTRVASPFLGSVAGTQAVPAAIEMGADHDPEAHLWNDAPPGAHSQLPSPVHEAADVLEPGAGAAEPLEGAAAGAEGAEAAGVEAAGADGAEAPDDCAPAAGAEAVTKLPPCV